MKKIITIICVIAFMLSFAGCSNNAEHKENGSDSFLFHVPFTRSK